METVVPYGKAIYAVSHYNVDEADRPTGLSLYSTATWRMTYTVLGRAATELLEEGMAQSVPERELGPTNYTPLVLLYLGPVVASRDVSAFRLYADRKPRAGPQIKVTMDCSVRPTLWRTRPRKQDERQRSSTRASVSPSERTTSKWLITCLFIYSLAFLERFTHKSQCTAECIFYVVSQRH